MSVAIQQQILHDEPYVDLEVKFIDKNLDHYLIEHNGKRHFVPVTQAHRLKGTNTLRCTAWFLKRIKLI